MPGGSQALKGILDIEMLGLLTIKDKTLSRQLAWGNNADKGQRNCQCKRAVQTEDGTPDSSTNKRQDADTQSQHNAHKCYH